MQRVTVERVAVGQLDDPPQVHHGDPIRNVFNHTEVVRNEQQREVQLRLQFLQEIEHLGLHRDVESRNRLIGHDQVGLEDEGSGNSNPLPLPTRELMRIPADVPGIEADQLEHPFYSFVPFVLVVDTMEPQPLRDCLSHLSAWIQRAVRILKHDLYASPEGLEGGSRKVSDVLSVKENGAAGWFEEPNHHPPERGLTAAGFSHETDCLTPPYVEIHPRHSLHRADLSLQQAAAHRELFHQIANLDEIVSHGHAPRRTASSAPCGLARSP